MHADARCTCDSSFAHAGRKDAKIEESVGDGLGCRRDFEESCAISGKRESFGLFSPKIPPRNVIPPHLPMLKPMKCDVFETATMLPAVPKIPDPYLTSPERFPMAGKRVVTPIGTRCWSMQAQSPSESDISEWSTFELPPTSDETLDHSQATTEFDLQSSHLEDDQLRLWSKDIKDRGDDVEILRTLIPKLELYVEGDSSRQMQVIECGFVPSLMTCMDTPFRVHVMGLLRKLLTGASEYPTDMDDTIYRTLASIPVRHPDCAVDCLFVLCELTRFEAGCNSAFRNKVPQSLGRILAACRHGPLVKPALQVLHSIASRPPYCRAVLDARIYETFQKIAIERLVQNFNRSQLNDLAMKGSVFRSVWALAITDDHCTRLELLRKISHECGAFCLNAFSTWAESITQWAETMLLCSHDDAVLEKAIQANLFDSIYVSIRELLTIQC